MYLNKLIRVLRKTCDCSGTVKAQTIFYIHKYLQACIYIPIYIHI